MIKFIRDTLEREGGNFKAGDVLDASPASENRWIKRGAAVVSVEEKPKPKAKAKPKTTTRKRAAKHKGK